MGIHVKENGAIICSDCNVGALRLKSYYEDLHRNDPDYFFEPWDDSDLHMFICPKCKYKDFPG